MTLDDMIRKAARQGDISHLTLAPTEKGFQANYRHVDAAGYAIAIHADPVEALKDALLLGDLERDSRKPRKPAPPKKRVRPRDIDDL